MKRAGFLVCAALVALVGCSDESGRTVEAFERLRDGTAEAVDALRDLTVAQRGVFLERAEEQLADLDERLGELRETASEKTRDRIAELERRREALGPKLEALKEAGGDAWAEVSSGFVDGLEELRQAADAARTESDR